MKKHLALVVSLLGTTILSGTSVVAQSQGDSGTGFRRGVMEQNNSDQIGDVTLYPHGDKTLVILRIQDQQDQPAGRIEPAYVHRGQTCGTVDHRSAYTLSPVVNGRSETILPWTMSRLLSGNYVVNVSISSQNNAYHVVCGELTPGT
jgi:hypothetical protein